MKDLLELMKTRRSVRKYKPDMIPQDVLDRIILAGTYSATGRNLQSPIIIAVTNKEMRDKISEMNRKIGGWDEGFDPFYGAPVILIVLADKSCPTYIYDGSLVMGNLMLAAHNEGVGSCWIHRAKEEFESEEGKEILRSLGIEGEYEGIGHCALGYTEGLYQIILTNYLKTKNGAVKAVPFFVLINELSRQKILCRPACPHMLRNTQTLCQQLSPCHCCLS